MSSIDDQEVAVEGGPTTNIRLHLRASNLPKSILNQQPDTLARISLYSPQQQASDSNNGSADQLPTPVPVFDDVTQGEEENGDSSLQDERVLDETEVKWFKVIPILGL